MYESFNTANENSDNAKNLNLIFEIYYLGFRTPRYKLYLMENFSKSQLLFFFAECATSKLGSKYWSNIYKQEFVYPNQKVKQ